MTVGCVPKARLTDFVRHVSRGRQLIGVRQKEPGFVEFAELDSPDELVLDYVSTPLPPKAFLYPPVETLVRMRLGSAPDLETALDTSPRVLVGVHPCDLHALAQLDVILGDHYGDPHYFARRQNTLLVGVDCVPDEHCFCGQVGTARADGKCDVFMTDVGHAYLFECDSDAGRQAVEGFAGIEEATPAALESAWAHVERKLAAIEPRLSAPVEMLPMLLDGHQKASEWEEVAAKCVSCGACNLVCPTCNCFDVYDEVALDLTEAERKRRWDGCMLREFTLVAGGEVFREGKPDRLRHRMQRKYNYLYVRYGSPFCTGCGRCARSCPAGIHPVSAVNQVTASES